MTISLPPSMRDWIEQIVARDEYATASEYLRELVREDQRRRARRQIDERLLRALDEPSRPLTKADWSEARRELRARLAKRRGKKAG